MEELLEFEDNGIEDYKFLCLEEKYIAFGLILIEILIIKETCMIWSGISSLGISGHMEIMKETLKSPKF